MPKKSQTNQEDLDVKFQDESIPAGKFYKVIFRQNRSFELYVNRKSYRFEPYGEMILSDDVVNHPDFQSHKNYFTVIEGGL